MGINALAERIGFYIGTLIGLILMFFILKGIYKAIVFIIQTIYEKITGKKIIKKKPKKEKKETTGIKNWEVLVCISVVIFILWLGAGSLYNSETSCEFPKMAIGNECCIPNMDYGIPLCIEEASKLSSQLEYAMENDLLTKGNEEVIADKFRISVPSDYYKAVDINVGPLEMPLYLISFGENEESLNILILHGTDDFSSSSIEESYDGFLKGITDSTLLLSTTQMDVTEPQFYSKDEFEYALSNSTLIINDYELKSAYALILGESDILMIYFMTEEPYFSEYYYEFENLVWSFKLNTGNLKDTQDDFGEIKILA